MAEETTHLKVVEVESDEDADVTLSGSTHHVAELCELVDLECLLQNQFLQAESAVDAIDVDVAPHRGLRGLEEKLEE